MLHNFSVWLFAWSCYISNSDASRRKLIMLTGPCNYLAAVVTEMDMPMATENSPEACDVTLVHLITTVPVSPYQITGISLLESVRIARTGCCLPSLILYGSWSKCQQPRIKPIICVLMYYFNCPLLIVRPETNYCINPIIFSQLCGLYCHD